MTGGENINGLAGKVKSCEPFKTGGTGLNTYEAVETYYGKVLQSSNDLKTSACVSCTKPDPVVKELISKIPEEVTSKFYGCGAPLPLGIQGLRVLDLGSGSGRDCYVCSALVGPTGFVTGIDMTKGQLEVAEKYTSVWTDKLGYPKPNMAFVKGHIEFLDKAGISDNSVDLIISNCVVNLSPDKRRVLSEAYRVLRNGGELYFSDVYCDRRMPAEALNDEVLWGECLSGALYINDFKRLAAEVGFVDPRQLSATPVEVVPELRARLGNANFTSITFRLFKLPGLLETLPNESYGQKAVYKGTIPGSPASYRLDEGHVYVTGVPAAVCGNTAAMLGEGGVSWLAPHFEIVGDRSVHYGAGGCEPSGAVEAPCGGGKCC